ncbi:MAG: response regulator [Gammaproteobacteria bacterium]|nr:response regulator [Gammaproteobacteria bacterium]
MDITKTSNPLGVQSIVKGVLILILIWTICIASSLFWNIYQTYAHSYQRAETTVVTNFNRDKAFREWITSHNGIYVRVSEQITPIHYLSNLKSRDFFDVESGDSLTLLDPATFLTSVMETFPENFDTTIHKIQGFISGDIMGAAGVYLNLKPFLESAKKLSNILIFSHVLIWAFGYIAIVLYGKKTENHFNQHLKLENQLHESYDQLEMRVEQRTYELSKLSKAVENSPSMVIITDNKGLIEYVNPRFTEITGYSSHDVIGKNPSIMKSPNTDDNVYQELWGALSKGLLWTGELCNLRFDGTEFWVSASISPMYSDNEHGGQREILNYIAVEEDITEKKLIERNLILAKNSAEEANLAKSEFLASMSHELRTPLNAILGFSQLSEYDANLNKTQKENSMQIYKAGKHLLNLIDDVLDLTRIEIGKVNLNHQSIRVQDLINECYELIKPIADEKNIVLEFENYKCKCIVYADYTKLKQIIINLLSNAVKYSTVSGRINLTCNEGYEGFVKINIIDSGEGIDDNNMKKLFEPFNRLGKEGSNIEGTGIGLVIAKKLIEMMNGRIEVKSVINQGSTFTLVLPRYQESKKAVPDDNSSLNKQIFNKENSMINIFYIEDNQANLRLMQNIIDLNEDWKLNSATTAEEGIELIKQQVPDIILMDINLPQMDGIEAFKHLKEIEHLKNIPIIAVSAGAMKENINKAIDAGFETYITKPIDINALIETIRKLT